MLSTLVGVAAAGGAFPAGLQATHTTTHTTTPTTSDSLMVRVLLSTSC